MISLLQKPPVPIWVYQAFFKSNFPFWLLQQIAPRSLDTMLDVSPMLCAELTPAESYGFATDFNGKETR
jgi:hypothetical protein